MGPLYHFAANFWWLVFPLGGAIGGTVRAIAAANERRADRRLERYRLKQQAKIAAAEASGRKRNNDEGYRREVAKLLATHDRTDARWLDYEVDIAKLLDFPLMTDLRNPLTVAFHNAKRQADSPAPQRLLRGRSTTAGARPAPAAACRGRGRFPAGAAERLCAGKQGARRADRVAGPGTGQHRATHRRRDRGLIVVAGPGGIEAGGHGDGEGHHDDRQREQDRDLRDVDGFAAVD